MSTRRIAALAGVSATTVSLVLHNSPKIPVATKQRVLGIARRLGYRPNAKLAELMAQVRQKTGEPQACFGVVSLYDSPRPWENVVHLSRIHEGMTRRAEALGYRLEPFWLRAPGMTAQRMRRILDARGIQGLLCFGSPNIEDELPPELNNYTIVTQGVSISSPVHRVTTNVYNEMWRLLRKVEQLGYRRPGLVLGEYEGARSAHAYLCVYLGWSELVCGRAPILPVLRMKHVEEEPLLAWLETNKPDVLILAHHYNALLDFDRILLRHNIPVPGSLGVAVMTQVLEGTRFSGLQANPRLVGEWAVELLVARIMNRDFGIPFHPRVEMAEMDWVDGQSLRSRRT